MYNKTGQVITILPNCDEITVLAVLNNDDQKIPYGKPGENVKVIFKFFCADIELIFKFRSLLKALMKIM